MFTKGDRVKMTQSCHGWSKYFKGDSAIVVKYEPARKLIWVQFLYDKHITEWSEDYFEVDNENTINLPDWF